MNYYDKESRIIEQLQMSSIFHVKFLNYSLGLFKFFASLYIPFLYQNWINSSGKGQLPPDFYSDKYKYMLEVMRFDDYEQGSRSQNAIESKKVKQINMERRAKGLPLFDNENLVLHLNPDLSESSDNNLELYYKNYKDVIEKHNGKVESYNTAHPNFQLGFLLFDESPSYGETKEKHVGEIYAGTRVGPLRYFYSPLCKMFSNELLKLNVDYVIWITPYKQPNYYDNKGIIELYLLDVKKARRKGIKSIDYNLDNVLCLEANEKKWEVIESDINLTNNYLLK